MCEENAKVKVQKVKVLSFTFLALRFKLCASIMFDHTKLKKINDVTWEISPDFKPGMRVPARIIATEKLLGAMDDGVFEQITNVAMMPGIVGYAIALPDAHYGYGFPVGGVAAFDLEEGVISPGGIGFDINCGVRLVKTDLTIDDVQPRLPKLVEELFRSIPSGVGRKSNLRISLNEYHEMMVKGAQWAIEKGWGWDEDKDCIEEGGAIPGADPGSVSQKAIQRGINQLGTLGSGNHYLEIQKVDKIHNVALAKQLGFESKSKGQIALMIHCGSRGFGHQIATDYLRTFEAVMTKYGIKLPDRQLACAPFKSHEGKAYFSAMAAAANMAFSNRQIIMHWVRGVFEKVFGKDSESLGMHLIYDVAHNIAKVEEYGVDEQTAARSFEELPQSSEKFLIHRKGATRAFGPGNPALPKFYQAIGQPVILGGSMETGSYLLVGSKKAEEETFGSSAHGAGRTMSRTKAKKMVRGEKLQRSMRQRGILVKTASFAGLAEEAGLAYKDIDEVVRALSLAGISHPVVSFKPLGNIKG